MVYNMGKEQLKVKGRLIQHKNDYEYDCSCGGIPKYVGSEWRWECPDCGANNYKINGMGED